ncbi:hypothetical protein FOA52_010126 [Chlamydomonas sp. UWO 241]|nr:hypothetical protein FOA52_010126 [Chlamydomonas sp. UWO 241]
MSQSGGGPVVSRPPRGPSAAGKAYLIAYNFAMAVLWGGLLFVVVQQVFNGASPQEITAAAAPFARVPQWAAALEVLHACVGLVPSSPVMALMQWGGKAHAMFTILYGVAEAQTSWLGPVLLAVWAVSEVIRYPWYALSTAGACPAWLTWLRYSMFLPLYPLGVVCEMGLGAYCQL